MGNRSRTTAAIRIPAEQVPALPPSGSDRSPAPTTARRFRVRHHVGHPQRDRRCRRQCDAGLESAIRMVIRDSMTVTAERDGADWDGFVSSCADATGYHLWRWRYVFEEAFGHA